MIPPSAFGLKGLFSKNLNSENPPAARKQVVG